MKTYPKHKFNVFPEMQGDDYQRLVDDLATNGFDPKQPIWLYDNGIIDGWNRQRACIELGIPPHYRDFVGTDIEAIQFVMRTNKRRNLTSSQWACIAVEAEDVVAAIKAAVEEERRAKLAELANTQRDSNGKFVAGSDNKLSDPEQVTPRQSEHATKAHTKIAETFNTNRTYVNKATKLKEENPEVFAEIRDGVKTFTEWQKEEKVAKRKAEIEAKTAKPTTDPVDWFVNGDSRDKALEAPEGIKLIFTDPPYGMDFQSNRRVQSPKALKVANDGDVQTAVQLFVDAITPLLPKMVEDSAVLCWCSWRDERYFADALTGLGLEIKNSIVWVRPNHGTGDLEGAFAFKHDRLLFAVKGRPKLTPRLADVLEGSRFLNTEHPTKKPVDLIKRVITSLTHPGDIVADPFAGSCPVGVAAIESGRNFWGCELEKLYWTEGQEHIANAKKNSNGI